RAIEERVRRRLRGREVLGHGGLLGIRCPAKETVKRLRDEKRVLAATCPGDGTVMRLLPPLTISDAELDEGLAAIEAVLG
ncbi:MAG: hypothetical protein L6Q95_00385, partial [Planctomycetes bacterium]|nr:hypothetical protein [Planctomycetota bacterium]